MTHVTISLKVRDDQVATTGSLTGIGRPYWFDGSARHKLVGRLNTRRCERGKQSGGYLTYPWKDAIVPTCLAIWGRLSSAQSCAVPIMRQVVAGPRLGWMQDKSCMYAFLGPEVVMEPVMLQ